MIQFIWSICNKKTRFTFINIVLFILVLLSVPYVHIKVLKNKKNFKENKEGYKEKWEDHVYTLF